MELNTRPGERESDPMLDPRESSDIELDDFLQLPEKKSEPRIVPERRRFKFLALVFFSIVLVFALAGLAAAHFLKQEANADGSAPQPTATPSSTGVPASHVSPSEQFDLDSSFVITKEPTLRQYVFNITRDVRAPDGVEKSMILVNNQSPGPLIEANTGDTIRVVVNNMMASENTTIHWHGLSQMGSPWMDGVDGVTQCAIPPGESFTYEFILTDQRGTFWYHSHVSVQYTDGLFGPIVIHDPDEIVPTVDEDRIIMMGDVYHEQAEKVLSEYLGASPPWSGMSGMEPPPSDFLINGRNMYNCSVFQQSKRGHEGSTNCHEGSLYSTHVKTGQSVRLRLISHSTNTPFWFTVDNHTLEVVEVDGVEIEPINTSRMYLNPGQRYSVIIQANQTSGNYLMRAAAALGCFHLAGGMMGGEGDPGLEAVNYAATAILSYDDTDTDVAPLGTPWDLESTHNEVFGDEPWVSRCGDPPFDLMKPARKMEAYEVGSSNFHYFDYAMRRDGELYRTVINGTHPTRLKDNAALWTILQQDFSSEDASLDFSTEQHVMVSSDADTGTQIVINAGHMMQHPWHLHGQNFQIVGWGTGAFGEGTTQWNLENPTRRDTVTVPGSSHVVIRVLPGNPGVWALHCHILWHAEGGMFTALVQSPDRLQTMLQSLEGGISGKFCSAYTTSLPQ